MNIGPTVVGTIANGATTSGECDLGFRAQQVRLILPDLTGATVTLQAAQESGGTYTTFDKPNGGGAMTLPKQRAHVVDVGGSQYIKIVSASTEGSARTFHIQGVSW